MALADYINNKPVIETNRLILRPMIVSDISALKKWMPDKSIYTYWGKGPSKAGMLGCSCTDSDDDRSNRNGHCPAAILRNSGKVQCVCCDRL